LVSASPCAPSPRYGVEALTVIPANIHGEVFLYLALRGEGIIIQVIPFGKFDLEFLLLR
jgi:hypothetical protein